MNWYIYDDCAEEVAVINAPDLISTQREAREMGYDTSKGYSIERA